MSAAEPKTTPKTIYLKDYRAPDFLVDTVELHFDLGEERTRVRSRLAVRRNPAGDPGAAALVLGGEGLGLRSVRLDGRPLAPGEYRVDDETLRIPGVPGAFVLETETEIRPQDNTRLEGLYKSSGNFCTQCEAEGFRRITYFPDRPDVMARYTTTIVADQAKYPVLLSNGNLIERGGLDGGRHYATWRDPFPKPCYLFALVAGDLARVEDRFVTMSGRSVALHMYVQRHNADKCDHAMASLKQAMAWDERVYGREYDLDVYMVVAVDDFNMGAMENKGLNVFNSKYVLARPETATDADYQAIEGVIGHEYFHNWSGNRVTCRDWFQLSLKEGFTVFRDQQFSADMTSGAVKRIHDVNVLRTVQFREDAGPMAHPVRPESYVEINNFYTVTVYNKGAELVRMLHHLLGPERFRRGTDLYFSRHDGQAVTTEDFVKALEDANGIDLQQFRLWYGQAGTPELHVTRSYDASARTYALTVRQTCPPTPGQPRKQPFHIPLALGLLDAQGRDLPLRLQGERQAAAGTRVLAIRRPEETFVFADMPHAPVPSLLRGFSAPVKLFLERDDAELAFLMAHDGDGFNRWEAGQQLAVKVIMRLVADYQGGRALTLDRVYAQAFRQTLEGEGPDRAFLAQALTLPSETYLTEFMTVIDPPAIHEARRYLRAALAAELKQTFLSVYELLTDTGPYRPDAHSVGRRSLRNLCLGYLMELDDAAIRRRCLEQFHRADNMTDVMAALGALANSDCPERPPALAAFYEKWRGDPLVVDKWLGLQATSRLPDTLAQVQALTRHPAFNIKNPNKVRALIGAFCQGNPVRFHDAGGAGYAFLAEHVLTLDALNPQVAARLAGALSLWRKYDRARQALMRAQLECLLRAPGLSKDVYEIVSKSLA